MEGERYVREIRLIDWLLTRDPAVSRLARKYLLDESTPYARDGFLRMFLERFDPATGMWGGGVYGPKWISTFYTLRDLISLEIDPANRAVQRGLDTLLQNMWNPERFVEDDVCVAAMLLGMLLYARPEAPAVREIADYLLSVQLPDGGWNCWHRHYAHPVASVHTTLSAVEALDACAKGEIGARRGVLAAAVKRGEEYLLERRLFRRLATGEPILPRITEFHFPTRWKYDLLRALLYFAAAAHPYDPRMDEGMDILRERFRRGYLGKGATYTGKLHFSMEPGRAGAMNTIRGLRVLRVYDPAIFAEKMGGTIRLSEE
jgi:hypothetical protein